MQEYPLGVLSEDNETITPAPTPNPLTAQSLIVALENGIMDITFSKVNTEKRTLRCTRNSIIADRELKFDAAYDALIGLITVYDLEDEGYKSFYFDRLEKTNYGS